MDLSISRISGHKTDPRTQGPGSRKSVSRKFASVISPELTQDSPRRAKMAEHRLGARSYLRGEVGQGRDAPEDGPVLFGFLPQDAKRAGSFLAYSHKSCKVFFVFWTCKVFLSFGEYTVSITPCKVTSVTHALACGMYGAGP